MKNINTKSLVAVILLVVAGGIIWSTQGKAKGDVVSDAPIISSTNVAAPILAQSETAVATRVCAKAEKVVGGLDMTPPLQLSDCVEADRACVKLWGPHSVWAGAADQNNVPYCGCDDGFTWVYGSTPGTGKCVRSQ